MPRLARLARSALRQPWLEALVLREAGGECAGPHPALPLRLQCAEACRAAFPDEDFMHLAGLLAPLGKLLAHAK